MGMYQYINRPVHEKIEKEYENNSKVKENLLKEFTEDMAFMACGYVLDAIKEIANSVQFLPEF